MGRRVVGALDRDVRVPGGRARVVGHLRADAADIEVPHAARRSSAGRRRPACARRTPIRTGRRKSPSPPRRPADRCRPSTGPRPGTSHAWRSSAAPFVGSRSPYFVFRSASVLNIRDHRNRERDLQPPARAALPAAGAARLGGRRARRAPRRVAPDRPPRRRAPAGARLSGRLAHRPGRRLPPRRRGGDAAPAARRRGGDRDRRRPADRGARLGRRDRGDLAAGAGEARAGAAGPAAPPRPGAGRGQRRRPRGRADGRPAEPQPARRRVPRRGARAVRLPGPRGRRDPPRGRAALAGQPRPPLVPARLGPPARGLAHVPGRPPLAAGGDRGALPAPRPPGAGRRGLRGREHLLGASTATRRG